MLRTTLVCVFHSDGRILLAMKKRGFGAGKWNGAGGKCGPGETILACITRELEEETGLSIPEERFESAGTLRFRFPHKPEWDQECHVFRVAGYNGPEPVETEEMRPQWFATDHIPYPDMWDGDRRWFPDFLAGRPLDWTLAFDENQKVLEARNHAE